MENSSLLIKWLNGNSMRRHFFNGKPTKLGTSLHYLGSNTRYLRGKTDSKHRKQVIQGKGTFKKPYSQKPYAHMHVQQEGSTRLLYLNVQGEIHLQRQVNFPLLFARFMKKTSFFHDKTALPKGYHYLKKITLGSRKMKRNGLWKGN